MVYVVKFQYKGDMRRATIDNPLNWEETCNLVKSLFSLNEEFTLKYVDEDGDTITVSTDGEILEAFRYLKDPILRFTVEEKISKDEKKTTNDSKVKEIDINLGELSPLISQLIESFCSPDGLQRKGCPFRRSSRKDSCDIHHRVVCDGCDTSPIKGIRWKCTVCPDYDLCEQCQKNGIHSQHSFSKIEQPINYFGNSSTQVTHRGIQCDSCKTFPIRGLRYKCETCQDYDLCDQCKQDGIHKEHNFTVFRSPRCGHKKRCSSKQSKEDEIPIKTTPIIPLRFSEDKNVVKEDSNLNKPELVKKPEESVKKPEEPVKKPEESVKKPELAENLEVSPFADKLKQLSDMGFFDTKRNIELLNKNNGDMIKSVMDLLN